MIITTTSVDDDMSSEPLKET